MEYSNNLMDYVNVFGTPDEYFESFVYYLEEKVERKLTEEELEQFRPLAEGARARGMDTMKLVGIFYDHMNK